MKNNIAKIRNELKRIVFYIIIILICSKNNWLEGYEKEVEFLKKLKEDDQLKLLR